MLIDIRLEFYDLTHITSPGIMSPVLETPHVIIAATIATKIKNPLLSLPLALASHFVFEMIPHWNPHINTEKRKFGKISKKSTVIIMSDSLMSLAVGSVLAFRLLPDTSHTVSVLLACFTGVLPDLIEAPYYFLNSTNSFIVNKWIPFKKSIQSDTGPFWGVITQVAVSLVALAIIFLS